MPAHHRWTCIYLPLCSAPFHAIKPIAAAACAQSPLIAAAGRATTTTFATPVAGGKPSDVNLINSSCALKHRYSLGGCRVNARSKSFRVSDGRCCPRRCSSPPHQPGCWLLRRHFRRQRCDAMRCDAMSTAVTATHTPPLRCAGARRVDDAHSSTFAHSPDDRGGP